MKEQVGKVKLFEKLIITLGFINMGKNLKQRKGEKEKGPNLFLKSFVYFARVSLFNVAVNLLTTLVLEL